MKKFSRDERGIAQVVLVALVVVVVAVVGFAAWRIMDGKKDSKNNTNTANSATNKEAEDTCNRLYNDKDLCKFASNSALLSAAYKANFVTTDKDGKASSFESEQDGKGNSSIVNKENGKETSAFILLNGDSYIKDVISGSWTKYPKSPETSKEANPTEDLKIDFKEEEGKAADKRVTYKKLGKEKCGNANCFKYQVTDPSDEMGTESIVWFGDKDYTLHKWSFKDKDGSTNVGEFTYTSVTITAPSPIKEAPKVPTEAEIQKQIEDAMSATE